MAENIKSGKHYRVYNGESWDTMHFETDTDSVYAKDGKTLEEKVGAIKGITTSTDVTEEGYAADATVVAALNYNLGEVNESLVAQDNLKFQFATDGEGNYGYLGADDSFIPFKSGSVAYRLFGNGCFTDIFTLPKGTYIIETVTGCFSVATNAPFVYLYNKDDTLFFTPSRTILYDVRATDQYGVIHSLDTFTLEEDTELYIYHTYSGFHGYAMSTIYSVPDYQNLVSLVPSVGGTAICGSYFTDCQPSKAFDGNGNTHWASNSRIPDWIGYKFDREVCVKKVIIKNTSITNQQVSTFRVEASNDGNDWIPLTDVLSNKNMNSEGESFYTLDNNNSYLYYRINCLTGNGTTWVSFRSVEFCGY